MWKKYWYRVLLNIARKVSAMHMLYKKKLNSWYSLRQWKHQIVGVIPSIVTFFCDINSPEEVKTESLNLKIYLATRLQRVWKVIGWQIDDSWNIQQVCRIWYLQNRKRRGRAVEEMHKWLVEDSVCSEWQLLCGKRSETLLKVYWSFATYKAGNSKVALAA